MTTTIERTVSDGGQTSCFIKSKFGKIAVSRLFSTDGETLKPATVNWGGGLSEDNENLSWFIAAMRKAQSEAAKMNVGIFVAQAEETIDL